MLRFSDTLRAFGGLILLVTGCGGLLSRDGGSECAAPSCDGGGSSGAGGSTGNRAGKGGGKAGVGGSGRGGTGNETGGTAGVNGGTGGSTGGSVGSLGGSGGSTGGSGAIGGTAPRGGSSGSDAGAPSASNECDEPSDCTLVAVDCCGSCQPTASDFVALNRDGVNDYLITRPCTDRLCPECAPTGAEWITATCITGLCGVLDARESELSACEKSDDCRLRAGLGCCESCDSQAAYVSLNVSSEPTLEGLVCDSEFACDECVAVPPDILDATCVSGRCQTMPPTR